jgi:hypothetical protein
LNSNSYNSGPLVKDQVVAFRTSENGQQQYGLLQVTAITTGSAAALTIQVKVEK